MRLDRGRVADAISSGIEERLTAQELQQLAVRAGMKSMVVAAQEYLEQGLTSIRELYRSFGIHSFDTQSIGDNRPFENRSEASD